VLFIHVHAETLNGRTLDSVNGVVDQSAWTWNCSVVSTLCRCV